MRYVLEAIGTDVILVEIDGAVTVHNPQTARSVPLGPTANDVLALCDGTMDEAGIVRLLADAFGGQTEETAVGVGAAIELLLREMLIRRVERTVHR